MQKKGVRATEALDKADIWKLYLRMSGIYKIFVAIPQYNVTCDPKTRSRMSSLDFKGGGSCIPPPFLS